MERPMVLVVDDNVDNADMFGDTLLLGGWYSATANTGKSAINWLEMNEAPDLILLDINMPDLDGRSVYQYIRQKDKFEQTIVIVVTANSYMANVMSREIHKKDRMMPKPVFLPDLQAVGKEIKAAFKAKNAQNTSTKS